MTTKKFIDRIEYYDNAGRLHREDGPAIEYFNGDKYWFIHGTNHRLDGPAIEWTNGTKHWYVNDKLHRIDGPAKEYISNGQVIAKHYYLNDVNYSFEEWDRLRKLQVFT